MLEIINQKYMNFLFEIAKKPKNISELAKKGDLTLSVASTLISRLEKEGALLKQKSEGERGKEIIITLTDYGKAQVDLLRKLNKNYKENKVKKITNIEGVNFAATAHPPKGCEFDINKEKEVQNDI